MQNIVKNSTETKNCTPVLSKLLMVDDSKVIRKSASKMLGDQFDIVVAENGAEGWQFIQDDLDIQVVFTDLDMPVMNGYELLKKVRSHSDEGICNMPVIVITGADNDEQAKEKAYELGATDFITKPFNSTDVKARAAAHADYQRLKKTSNIDVQTGLLNRQGFELQLDKDLSYIQRHHQEFAVMMLELDDFKALFLKVGRTGSHVIISQLAKVLEEAVRKEDTVGRVGIDRFVISLPAAKPDAVKALAERICATVEGFKLKQNGERLAISLTSAAFVPDFTQTVNSASLFERMEQILLKARSSEASLLVELAVNSNAVTGQLLSLDKLQEDIIGGDFETYQQALQQAIPQIKQIIAVMSVEQRRSLNIDTVD